MAIGNLVTPTNIAPGSPATYEQLVDLYESVASADNASGQTAHGTNIANATTNSVLTTVPAASVNTMTAGNVVVIRSWGYVTTPSSGPATLAWNTYSNGSSGTALTTFTAVTPTVSMTATFFDVESVVTFYTATTVQCIQVVRLSTSASTSAAAVYLAGNSSATPVTLVSNSTLTQNVVMGSAVSGSIYEGLGGYWQQVA